MGRKPIAQSAFFAGGVVVSFNGPHSATYSLINVFSNLSAEKFPMRHKFCVGAVVSGADRAYGYVARIIHLETSKELWSIKVTKDFGEAHDTNLISDEVSLMIPEPGTYQYELLVEGELVATTTLFADLLGSEPEYDIDVD